MTTIVPGLIKIGSTKDAEEFKTRMRLLENNGYKNVTGLKRYYAVQVEDYKEQEQEMFESYKPGRVGTTELFAADIGVVAKHMSRLKGKKVYPEDISEDEVLTEAEDSIGVYKISDGVNIVAVSKRLGHTGVSITLSIYTHLLEKNEDELIDNIESNFIKI